MPQKNELIHSGFSASPLFICGKNIRSSSLRETNIAKSNSTSRIFVMSLMGRVEPHLNGFCLPLSNSPKVGVEFESNCSRIAVNKPKMRPLHTLSTFELSRCRVHSSIRFQGTFEPDSFRVCAAVNKAKMRPPETLCTFKVEDAECSYRRVGAKRSLRSINLRF